LASGHNGSERYVEWESLTWLREVWCDNYSYIMR
jgi:hypothetical protein